MGAIRLVTPALQTFQIHDADDSVWGYRYEGVGLAGGHFIRAWDPPSRSILEERFLKLACHMILDMTPAAGLGEFLERASEIREYYSSLQEPGGALLAQPEDLKMLQTGSVYEREAFAFPEE